MIRDFVREILQDLSIEEANDDLGLPREKLADIKLRRSLVLNIQGVRRCGKSTLMKQIIEKYELGGSAIYVNFEDPRFADILDHQLLDEIVEFHEGESPKNLYYFFDEIQNIRHWEKWLHVQVEKKKRYFVISGSNSALLSGTLGKSLTGRHNTVELFPFSYAEFKKFTYKNLDDYLLLGGFPLALSQDRPKEILRDYFRDIIERDARQRVAARSARSLTQLAKCLFESTGSETSYRSLANSFDTTPDTIRSYVDAFETTYLIMGCPYFTYSERKAVVRPKKYYPIDLGLRSAIVTKTGSDRGKNIETAVFHSLRRKYNHVSYWRDKHEVDFVIENDAGIQPVQVTMHDFHDRHFKALEEFKREYPKALEPLLINHENLESIL